MKRADLSFFQTFSSSSSCCRSLSTEDTRCGKKLFLKRTWCRNTYSVTVPTTNPTQKENLEPRTFMLDQVSQGRSTRMALRWTESIDGVSADVCASYSSKVWLYSPSRPQTPPHDRVATSSRRKNEQFETRSVPLEQLS